MEPTKKDNVFVLFLPENEIHEIGLLFINYEIILRGYKTIYLGQTMPLESLIDLKNYYENIHFVSYFTVVPTKDKMANYIVDFTKYLGDNGKSSLWVLGRQIQHLNKEKLPSYIRTFASVEDLSTAL
jgi:methanogenic corrinoid protein MtbC1